MRGDLCATCVGTCVATCVATCVLCVVGARWRKNDGDGTRWNGTGVSRVDPSPVHSTSGSAFGGGGHSGARGGDGQH